MQGFRDKPASARRWRTLGLWAYCLGAGPFSFIACSDDGNLLGSGESGGAGETSSAGTSSSSAGTHSSASGAAGSAGMTTTGGSAGSASGAAGSASTGGGVERGGGGAAGESGGSPGGEAGAGHGGSGTLDPGSCSANSDCGPCGYGAPPASASDCYCTSCPEAVASTAQCDRNRKGYLDVCPNGQALMCGGAACAPAPVAMCVQNKCVRASSPTCGTESCTAGEVCVAYRTVGGALFVPDQNGMCPAGRHVEGDRCEPDFGYTCAPLSQCTSLGTSCHCASGSRCASDNACRVAPQPSTDVLPEALLICEQQVP